MRGKILVSQASKRLSDMGVQHGIFMANEKSHDPIQCCSIDTILSRGIFPDAKFIVVDECHDADSDGYREFLSHYPNALVLGVSATPFGNLEHVGEKILAPVSIKELIRDGYLVRLRYFAPSTIDVSGVKLDQKTKDFRIGDLAAASQKGTITGDIVSHWKRLGQNRPTLAFCVNIEHAMNMAKAFNDAGIRATTLTGSDPMERRKFCFENLGSYYQVITSVGVLTRGVDIPHASCLIVARPTRSLALWIQIMGRGTRTFPGKEDCLILDHAGNCARHGFIENEPSVEEIEEKKTKKQGAPEGPLTYTCASCYGVAERPVEACPYCGEPVPEKERTRSLKEEDGELKELLLDPLYEAKKELRRLQKIRKERGFRRGWIYHQMRVRFGEAVANDLVPKRKIPAWLAISFNSKEEY